MATGLSVIGSCFSRTDTTLRYYGTSKRGSATLGPEHPRRPEESTTRRAIMFYTW